jgi:hypothetical protein
MVPAVAGENSYCTIRVQPDFSAAIVVRLPDQRNP